MEAKHQNAHLNADQLEQRLTEIALHCSQLPDQDHRSVEEILGYDEMGLPC